jgi:hypothetical protein
VIRNRVWLAFEKYGARCVLAAAYDPAAREAQVLVGAPVTNPSAPGEEEYVGTAAFRCSAFKEMNGGGYADAVYAAVAVAGGWRFTSPDGAVVKTISVPDGGYDVSAAYTETVSGSLYVRLGLSPNPGDLFLHGDSHLTGVYDGGHNTYTLANSAGGAVHLALGSASFNAAPADAGANRRNLALTEQVEVYGAARSRSSWTLIPGRTEATGADDAARLWLRRLRPVTVPVARVVHLEFPARSDRRCAHRGRGRLRTRGVGAGAGAARAGRDGGAADPPRHRRP